MNIENIFVNVLASDQLNVDNAAIEKFCFEVSQRDSGRKVSNEGGYQSNIFDMSTTPELSDLHKEIQLRADAFYDYMGFKKSLKKLIDQCWININPPGTYNSVHTHNGGVMTGIYYVKVPENSGDLQMFTPNRSLDFVLVNDYIDHSNHFNSSNVLIRPAAGKLYMFPCWIPHQVKMNLSAEPRISIAFDIPLV